MFAAQLFYRVAIPVVIGALFLYVLIDASRRMRTRWRFDHVQHD